KTRNEVHAYHPPLHAKGVEGSRYAPVSWLASKDAMSIRHTQPAFPGFPGDRLQFPRLQLRGSAGISPASLSFAERQKTRIPKDMEKNEKAGARNLMGGWQGSQMHRPRRTRRCTKDSNWIPRDFGVNVRSTKPSVARLDSRGRLSPHELHHGRIL